MLNTDLVWYQLKALKLKEHNARVQIWTFFATSSNRNIIKLGLPELYSTDHCRGNLLKELDVESRISAVSNPTAFYNST
jgi:hypothetical protein